MITPAHRLSLSVMLTTLPVLADALTLGGLAARSSQGQPLDASVELYLAPHERSLPMVVSVTPDLFAGNRVSLPSALSGVTARVEHAPGGYSYIHLRTVAPITLPTLNFRLHIAQAERGLSRTYALSLPAPRMTPATSAASRPRSATRRPAPTLSGDDYIVRSGDSLWTIAKRWEGAGDINSRMEALHAANPAAFVDGDRNRLTVGARLRLPEATNAVAPATVVARAVPIPDSGLTSTAGAPPAARPEEDPRSTAAAAPATTLNLPAARGRDPVLTARLAELDTKFAAIRARVATAARTETARTMVDEAAFEAALARAAEPALPEPVATAPAEAPAVGTAAIPATPPAAVVENPIDTAAAAAPAASSDRPYALISGLLAAAGALALFLWLRRRQQRERLQSDFQASEAARRAAVAAKFAGHAGSPRIDVLETVRLPPAELAAITNFGATLDGLDPEPKVVPVVRTLAETQDDIDASIAHGRYPHAEHLLLQVVAGSPRNVAAKLRLAEVYYITERVEEFIALADDLQLAHRGDMDNEDWRRVMRMGKIIAPERPLFAGPRAVNQG